MIVDDGIPMRPSHGLASSDFDAMEDGYFVQIEGEFLEKIGSNVSPRKSLTPSMKIQTSQRLSTSLTPFAKSKEGLIRYFETESNNV